MKTSILIISLLLSSLSLYARQDMPPGVWIVTEGISVSDGPDDELEYLSDAEQVWFINSERTTITLYTANGVQIVVLNVINWTERETRAAFKLAGDQFLIIDISNDDYRFLSWGNESGDSYTNMKVHKIKDMINTENNE